jgi:hypothetical protein
MRTYKKLMCAPVALSAMMGIVRAELVEDETDFLPRAMHGGWCRVHAGDYVRCSKDRADLKITAEGWGNCVVQKSIPEGDGLSEFLSPLVTARCTNSVQNYRIVTNYGKLALIRLDAQGIK